ncbi:MAG: Type 1 glutamine amidotransferase-like domain-containing protein [Deltaproteobacteria bacterium]|nr:Type 1 glutamine amidotransferase-like domain-containing protein [Deltaproteobacteria bacterium]
MRMAPGPTTGDGDRRRRREGTEVQGSILFNGNIERETDFIQRFKDRILTSRHQDAAVRGSRKVLMVTAAWKKDEYNEGHVRAALNAIGIPSRYEAGYDQNIQNLAVYHGFNSLKQKEPELYAKYHEKQEVIKGVKQFYRKKNTQLVALLKDQKELIQRTFPGTTLAQVLNYPVQATRKDLPSLSPRQLHFHYCCQDVQGTLRAIVQNDEKMVEICSEIDLYFAASSGLAANATYREMRARLVERILSANSIFIFGGHVAILYNRLNFFKLKEAFVEALRRGTNFYTISAGTGVLCNRIILYDDFGEDRHVARDFEFFDNGFGIVTKIQVFPHCMDRIKTDDPDNLAYLAHRFESSCCLGMNQESFLLMETVADGADATRERFVSMGEKDAVWVFDKTGRKTPKGNGEELALS